MPQNARALLKRWESRAKPALEYTASKNEFALAQEEAIAASRARPSAEKNAHPKAAGKHKAAVNHRSCRNWVNTDAMLSDGLESVLPSDTPTVPNNQVQAVWTQICAIAAIGNDIASWGPHFKRSRMIHRLRDA